jgi:hypothetical protein
VSKGLPISGEGPGRLYKFKSVRQHDLIGPGVPESKIGVFLQKLKSRSFVLRAFKQNVLSAVEDSAIPADVINIVGIHIVV